LSVGYTTVPELDFSVIARRELIVRGVRSGTRGDLQSILDRVAARQVTPPPVEAWPLDQINEALESLRRGTVRGKAVVIPRRP
jgi:D-arabinose 1-dehydrogenase-like Zn-dependent alcohol dehydrogenase